MIQNRAWLILTILGAMTFAGPAMAQEDDADGDVKVIYKNNQLINFEGLDVEGEIKKPAGSYLLERKKSNFSPLIKFRQNWDDEAIQSLHQKK